MGLFPKSYKEMIQEQMSRPENRLLTGDLLEKGLTEEQIQNIERMQADSRASQTALSNLISKNRLPKDFEAKLKDPGFRDWARANGYAPVVAEYEKYTGISDNLRNTAAGYQNALDAPKPVPEVRPEYFVDVQASRGIGPAGSNITRMGAPSMSEFLAANKERFAQTRKNFDYNKGGENLKKDVTKGEDALDRALLTQSGWQVKKDDGGATNFKSKVPGQSQNTYFRVAEPFTSKFNRPDVTNNDQSGTLAGPPGGGVGRPKPLTPPRPLTPAEEARKKLNIRSIF